MEPEIVQVPAFTVVGVKYRGQNKEGEIPRMWCEQFLPRAAEIPSKKEPWVFYGVMGNYDEATGEFDYVAGAEVEDASEIPEGMVSWSIPDNTYAAFDCTLPTLHEAFHHIYQEWLPTSDYRRAPGPEFEYYPPGFHEDQRMRLYVPVLRR